jgi:hypothetical protein
MGPSSNYSLVDIVYGLDFLFFLESLVKKNDHIKNLKSKTVINNSSILYGFVTAENDQIFYSLNYTEGSIVNTILVAIVSIILFWSWTISWREIWEKLKDIGEDINDNEDALDGLYVITAAVLIFSFIYLFSFCWPDALTLSTELAQAVIKVEQTQSAYDTVQLNHRIPLAELHKIITVEEKVLDSLHDQIIKSWNFLEEHPEQTRNFNLNLKSRISPDYLIRIDDINDAIDFYLEKRRNFHTVVKSYGREVFSIE